MQGALVVALLAAAATAIAVTMPPPAAHAQVDIAVLGKKINETVCKRVVDVLRTSNDSVVHMSPDVSVAMGGLDKHIFSIVWPAVLDYVRGFAAYPEIHSDTGWTLLTRAPSSETPRMSIASPPLYVTGVIMFLNGDVGGGELYFPRQRIEVTPACGTVVIFPNTYTYPTLFRNVRVGESHLMGLYFIHTLGGAPPPPPSE